MSDKFDKIKTAQNKQTSLAIERIQTDLEKEKDARNEERFVFVIVIIILLDIYCFADMETWSAPVIIGVLELLLLLALARKWGVDDVAVWLDKILGTLHRKQE